MIWTLVAKDLLRARRNWVAIAILLGMPLGITALVGAMFGPAARDGTMPRIKVAVVDEDQSIVGGLLRRAFRHERVRASFDPVVLERDQALRAIEDNQISAVIIVPEEFSQDFFTAASPPTIELIKNPTQSFMPAIVEELLKVVVEGLNAVSQNLTQELPDLIPRFTGGHVPDTEDLRQTFDRLREKLELAQVYVYPPLVYYQRETVTGEGESREQGFNIFAYLLGGMAAMFLLFIGDSAIQDVYKENRVHTLARYRTVRYEVFPFILSKGIYCLAILVVSSLIMLGGGGVLFGISWKRPLQVGLLATAYCVFCVGFASFFSALMKNEQRAAVFSSVIIMLMGFLGGSMMPVNEMPSVLSHTIGPWMPNYWFNESIKRLQFGIDGPNWSIAALQLVVLGVILIGTASKLFTRMLTRGVKA